MLRTFKTLAAVLFVAAFGAVALGVEPPQCNLPGWGVTTVTKTVTTFRNPVGHTHTCANGHTWDHQATAGHRCPICGATQFVQDRVPRKVTVVQTVKVTQPVLLETLPVARPVIQAAPYQPVFTVRYKATAGCASGNCPYAR